MQQLILEVPVGWLNFDQRLDEELVFTNHTLLVDFV